MFSADDLAECVKWRHDFHRHPELGFEEHRTGNIIATKLEGWGYRVHRGLGETGVVASLGLGDEAIGIRADMDALPIHETTGFEYSSCTPGRMHGCGHDGHMAMLLLAAKHIAEMDWGSKAIHLVFQPAEETQAGARQMIEDGLFERFPCREVYALHNWPALPVGTICARDDRMMAANGTFDIKITGVGGHGAMPENSDNVLSAMGQIIGALQQIPARNIPALEAGVVSVTMANAGTTYNACPDHATIAGTTRWFDESVGQTIESSIKRVATGIAASHGCQAQVSHERKYPATINTPAAAKRLRRVGDDISLAIHPGPASMASEDFAFMIKDRPGAYAFLGAARESHNPGLHAPDFDFNDSLLPLGAELWGRLAQDWLECNA